MNVELPRKSFKKKSWEQLTFMHYWFNTQTLFRSIGFYFNFEHKQSFDKELLQNLITYEPITLYKFFVKYFFLNSNSKIFVKDFFL